MKCGDNVEKIGIYDKEKNMIGWNYYNFIRF